MQRMPSRPGPELTSTRPASLSSNKSFTRFESTAKVPPNRSRAGSSQSNGVDASAVQAMDGTPRDPDPAVSSNDIFEGEDEEEQNGELSAGLDQSLAYSINDVEEIPIEIQSLMEKFLESLASRTHPTPLSTQKLAELFQNFYEHVSFHIGTHVATLSTRISRDQSPTPSASSSRPASLRGVSRKSSRAGDAKFSTESEQQMLTVSEVSERKRARKQLEVKRQALEEAVEKSVCEKVYPRIWRHKSTDDEEKDEKLRSRAASLSVIGVSLKELLTTACSEVDMRQKKEDQENDDLAKEQLTHARNSLEMMNEARFPLGKLKHLTNVHKSIVEALKQIMPASSSADEILPTLIFTIITSDPNRLHVISNLNFIQRFRASKKVDGEAAYCLTNLEAAISFLENIDLSSLRPDEPSRGVPKPSSQSSTPQQEAPDPLYQALSGESIVSPQSQEGNAHSISSVGSAAQPSLRNRRISILMQSRPFAPASEAADQAIEAAHNALNGSFRFLFGRLQEKQQASPILGETTEKPIFTPRTLEDAHKLVTSPIILEDSAGVSVNSEPTVSIDTTADNERVQDVPQAPGSQQQKDLGISAKLGPVIEVVQAASNDKQDPATVPTQRASSPGSANTAGTNTAALDTRVSNQAPNQPSTAVDSVRSLSNSFNPLRNLSSMGNMMRFSKAPSVGTPTTPTALPTSLATSQTRPLEAFKNKPAMSQPLLPVSSISPPMQRFLDMTDARELNGFDVDMLLRDYQRLAGALKAAGGPGGA